MNIDTAHDRVVAQPTTAHERETLTELRSAFALKEGVTAWWTLDLPEYDGLDADRIAGELGEKALVIAWQP